MSKRLSLMLLLAGSAVLFSFVRTPRGAADTPAANVGRAVAEFHLPDTRGQTVSLADFKGKKAVAVVFVGTECPINNAFMPRLAELSRTYTPRGVQFLAISSNHQDTTERVAEHARKYEVPFPVLKDADNVVADRFGARRTPEVFLLDATRTVRYRGRIDDQFGIGYKRAQPTRRDLAEAIDELLAGKAVSRPTTPVAGCVIARAAHPRSEGKVTFARDVAPIMQKNCQECHRPGQIGPMPLVTYDDARDWSETIREVLTDGRMPPWYADPRFGHFANDRRLSPKERDTLLAWLDQGTPRGDDRDLPPPRRFASDWIIGKPDVVLSMAKEYDVPADAPKDGIPYVEFFVDTGFKEDRWITRAECRPGAVEVVHHIVVFVVPPGQKFFPGSPGTPTLAGTAPGDMPLILPPGTGKKVPAGSQLVFQMHYTPNGRAQKDRSSIGLVFAREKPQHEVITLPVANPAFLIPAGADNYEVEQWWVFKEDAHILSFMPHMHLRGKDFRYEASYPDGRTETLLSVPRFNFNWQSVYRSAKPIAMPKGSRLHCVAHFDNSARNLNNPDPTKQVLWGDQTWEEMMIGWVDFINDAAN
jgi:peroxiredoxin